MTRPNLLGGSAATASSVYLVLYTPGRVDLVHSVPGIHLVQLPLLVLLAVKVGVVVQSNFLTTAQPPIPMEPEATTPRIT